MGQWFQVGETPGGKLHVEFARAGPEYEGLAAFFWSCDRPGDVDVVQAELDAVAAGRPPVGAAHHGHYAGWAGVNIHPDRVEVFDETASPDNLGPVGRPIPLADFRAVFAAWRARVHERAAQGREEGAPPPDRDGL